MLKTSNTDPRIEEMRQNAEPIHPKCLGHGFTDDERQHLREDCCDRLHKTADQNSTCPVYMIPDIQWRHGQRCPMASHFRPDLITEKGRGRVGQQKQKKHR